MKNLIFIIAFFICNLSFGQVVDIQSVENVDIVKLLNNLESFSENKTEDLSIRVYVLANESGSAGFESGEVTHKLYFAVSEFDEYPNQKVFVVGDFYSPKAIQWNNNNALRPELTIEFGSFDERKTLTFIVGLEQIKIK